MKYFNGAGEKRKWLSNMRHFAGTKQVSLACLGLFGLVPAALLVLGILALVAFFRNAGHDATPLALFGGGSIVTGLLLSMKGKLTHGILATALALGMGTVAAGQNVDPAVLNAAQRAAVLNQAVPMEQPIFSQAINTTTQLGPINVQPRNVGLIKGFQVIISGVIQNTDGAVDAVSTPFGIQNVLSNINFTDLNSNVRINTHGPHLANLNTAKGRWPYASALQTADWNGTAPLQSMSAQYGANFPVLVNLNALVHGTNKAFRMVYDVPLAYSDDDLRGCIYANVVNAVMNLGLTLNPTPFVATGADDTFAVLRSGTCSYLGNLQVTVYQLYLDQLPIGQNGPILPIIDLSTVYELKNSTFKAIAAGQDFPVPYANFRQFLSTFAIYNNTGSNDGHGVGADINYWSLQSANFTNIFKRDPLTQAQRSRDILGTDFPAGTYYFSHRKQPINTQQYGNMELVLNTITAGANSYLNICWEDFAQVNTLTTAGSLAGGAA